MGEDEHGRAGLAVGDAARFARCIADGGIALFPADTVYGLACDPLNPGAVRRLYELKGRPPTQPAAVMFFALAPALAALPEIAPRTRAALAELLPGPLTVLLGNPAGRFPLACQVPAASMSEATVDVGSIGRSAAARAETRALGLRVPSLPDHLAALAVIDAPVLQSSANISGGPDARRLREVAPALLRGVDLVLDGGQLPGVASTVLDLRDYERAGSWHVVREGPLGSAELERLLASC